MSRIAICFTSLAAIALLVGTDTAADAPKAKNIDAALMAAAPQILKELRDRKYENVGVLKFMVADRDGVLRPNAGPLNRTLADRLEVALTLLLEDDDKLGIIAGASDGAASNPRANHVKDADGRAQLFKIRGDKFSVPWKPNQEIMPDAFLTGEATISKDRRSIAVKVQLFDKKNPKEVVTVAEFTAANDARTLTETGVTFRGADFAEALAMADKAAPAAGDKADDLQKKADDLLALLKQSPVKLEIFYDGVKQQPVTDPGDKYSTNVLLRIPPADKDTKVTFVLTNDSDETYGIVLRVNGRNTIYEQRQDPVSCYKWILEKGKHVTIKGFQVDENNAVPFKVKSPSQSEIEALSYGDNAGTIDMILFRGVPKPESALVKADPEIAAISRGAMVTHGEPPAADLKSFKSQLKREGAETVTASAGRKGGLITAGEGVDKNPVKSYEFYPAPVPALSATIRYYSLK